MHNFKSIILDSFYDCLQNLNIKSSSFGIIFIFKWRGPEVSLFRTWLLISNWDTCPYNDNTIKPCFNCIHPKSTRHRRKVHFMKCQQQQQQQLRRQQQLSERPQYITKYEARHGHGMHVLLHVWPYQRPHILHGRAFAPLLLGIYGGIWILKSNMLLSIKGFLSGVHSPRHELAQRSQPVAIVVVCSVFLSVAHPHITRCSHSGCVYAELTATQIRVDISACAANAGLWIGPLTMTVCTQLLLMWTMLMMLMMIMMMPMMMVESLKMRAYGAKNCICR